MKFLLISVVVGVTPTLYLRKALALVVPGSTAFG